MTQDSNECTELRAELSQMRAENVRKIEDALEMSDALIAALERADAAEGALARVKALCERMDANGGVVSPRAIRNAIVGRPTYALEAAAGA
jgi:transcription elongation GreA/GreB family factor